MFLSTQGFFVEFLQPSDQPPSYSHTLGGNNTLPGAICPACRRPFLLMLTVDVRDPALKLNLSRGREEFSVKVGTAGTKVSEADPELVALHDLPLLYCWYCCSPTLTYRINPCGGIDVLDNDRLTLESPPSPPYDNYPLSFTSRPMRLIAVSPEIQDLIHRSNERTLPDDEAYAEKNSTYLCPRHQVGGEPFLVQGTQDRTLDPCTLCGGNMPIFAALADNTGSKQGFAENSFAQVIFQYCVGCQVVSCYNECD